MKYYAITPKACESQCVYYSEITNRKNERITYSYLSQHRIAHDEKLSCTLLLEGIDEPIIFNKDGIPLVQIDVIKNFINKEIEGVDFIPLVNNYFAMFVYNNFDCIEQNKNNKKGNINNQLIINCNKIYSEIFRIHDNSIPFLVSENIYHKITKLNIHSIDFCEIISG